MTTHSIVFIDSRVADHQTLVAGLGADTAWVLLEADQDGLLQMQATLVDEHDLESIRIISHGRPGAVVLGSFELSQETIDEHVLALTAIGQSLGEQGDVQIYACEVGKGAVGRSFVHTLSEAVGAYVAVASSPVGHADLGGGWMLDVGNIATQPISFPEWPGVLGLISIPSKPAFPGHSSGEFRNTEAFAALRADGSVVTWGYNAYGGDSTGVATLLDGSTVDVTQIFSTGLAFAALRVDGSVVTWGLHAGDSSAVAAALDGSTVDVTHIYSTGYAFAALRADGSVVTWGLYGGDSSGVAAALDGSTVDVTQIYSTSFAFAALRADGSVVTWGDSRWGGDSTGVAAALNGSAVDVTQIYSTDRAFAALRADGSVVTWGYDLTGGNSSGVAAALDGSTVDVTQIFSTPGAFAALRADGSVVTWGDSRTGGSSTGVAAALNGSTVDVTQIFSNRGAFAALRADGSVVTWGHDSAGGNSSGVGPLLDGSTVDVVQIFSTSGAFAALRDDGSVVTWGDSRTGGSSIGVAALLDGTVDVTQIFSTRGAFAALRADGSVVTWGETASGGDSTTVAAALDGSTVDVTYIFSTDSAFAALRADGSVVTWGYSGVNSIAAPIQLTNVVSMANPYTNDVYKQIVPIYGTTGNDPALMGTANDDEIYGLAGNDKLDGQAGNDTMFGGLDNDTYWVRQVGDIVTEKLNEGTDIAYSYLAAYTLTANVENGRILATGAANLTGNSLNNTLYASSGNNVLTGGGGSDTVSYLYGVTGTTGVTVSLASAASQPTVVSGSDTLSGIVNLTGSNNADHLTGSVLANVLNGGAEIDTMEGGLGNDTYYLDSASDQVVESTTAALLGGNDTVILGSAITSYTLGTNVDNGRITSTGAANLTGNSLNNVLYAGAGNNVINGGTGIDTLSYAYMSGPNGVTVSLALAPAQATVGSGTDTISAIENLTGSAYADTLTGNSGTNVINGGIGNDTIDGGTGSDTAVFSGSSTGYRVDFLGGKLTVTDTDLTNGNYGTDSLTSIERLSFSDKTISTSEALKAVDIFRAHGGEKLGLVGTLANFSKAAYSLGSWEKIGDNARINDEADSGGLVGSGRHADDVKSELFASEWSPLGLTVTQPALSYLEQEVVPGDDTVAMLSVSTYWTLTDNTPAGYVPGTEHPVQGTDPVVFGTITNGFSGGLYTSGNASALVARCADSVVISFRGTNDNRPIDSTTGTINSASDPVNAFRPDVGQWDDMAVHYSQFAALVTALGQYLDTHNEIKTVYVTGHSLGGAMALKYMKDHDDVKDVNGVTTRAYQAITFAAPAYDFIAKQVRDSRITCVEIQNDPVPSTANTADPQGDILYFVGDKTLTGGTDNHSMEYYRDVAWDVDDATWGELIARTSETEILLAGERSVSNRIEDFVVSTRDDTLIVNANESALRSIDVVYGGRGIDKLTGDGSAELLLGGAGNDVLNGAAGADTMKGGADSDTYYVDNAGDVVTETNADSVAGGIDLVASYLSTYTLTNNVENGRIMNTGVAGLNGNALDNVIYAAQGDNSINGGDGIDTVSYAITTGLIGITIRLDSGLAQATGGSGSDTLVSIEKLIGSAYADKLTGNSLANALTGLGGNDTLDGGTGIDTLTGGDGSDFYYVRDDGDIVTETNAVASTGGTDLAYSYISSYTLTANVENGRIVTTAAANLTGNNLSNVIYAGAGNNVLSGGTGTEIDTVSYAYGLSGTTGVTVDLSSTAAQATVGSGSDTLSKIENVIGSAYADKLTGSSGTNVLTGGAGADTLKGNGGNDIFDFNTLAEMGTSFVTWDVISDFNFGDKIDLSTLDANTATTTNDAFNGTLVTAFTAAGQLKLSAGVLYGNTDANYATNEFAIQLTGVNTLTAADFVV